MTSRYRQNCYFPFKAFIIGFDISRNAFYFCMQRLQSLRIWHADATRIKIRDAWDVDGYPGEQVGRFWHRCMSSRIYANLSWIRHCLVCDVREIYPALLASSLFYNKPFRIVKNTFFKMHPNITLHRILYIHYILLEYA